MYSPTSVESQPGSISGAPHQAIFAAGQVYLLAPQVHRVVLDANIGNPGVDIPPPLRLQGLDVEWYERTFPRPAGAPAVFRCTRPGVLLDRVVESWKAAGLLKPNPNLKYVMPMFLVPKPDNPCNLDWPIIRLELKISLLRIRILGP